MHTILVIICFLLKNIVSPIQYLYDVLLQSLNNQTFWRAFLRWLRHDVRASSNTKITLRLPQKLRHDVNIKKYVMVSNLLDDIKKFMSFQKHVMASKSSS